MPGNRQEGVTPWAPIRIQVKPPLEYLIQREDLEVPKAGKALVPGCGRVNGFYPCRSLPVF